jgi:peptidoglycan hydrolase CwlO-like protein
MSIATPLAMMPRAHADMYDDQINALQSKVNQYKQQAGALQVQIGSLQAAVNELEVQKNIIQTQIDLNQTKYEQLQQQIKDTEQKIADNKAALGEILADIKVGDSITPLEMLASSNNVADYVDKQSYRSSASDTLKSMIDKIKQLKIDLDKAKADTEKVLADQNVQKNALIANQQQQQVLLDQTRGEEAAYQSLIGAAQQQMSDASARQAAYYRSLQSSPGGGTAGVVGSFQYTNWSGNQGACGGGYGYSPVQGRNYCSFGHDAIVDEWQLYNRECVSYVAWALQYRFNKQVNGFHGRGNAMDWPQSAPAYSNAYRVSSPQPGDVVVLPASGSFAPIGHVMIVESVSGDWMHVSQYNFYGTGQYSTMDVKNSGVILLRFP